MQVSKQWLQVMSSENCIGVECSIYRESYYMQFLTSPLSHHITRIHIDIGSKNLAPIIARVPSLTHLKMRTRETNAFDPVRFPSTLRTIELNLSSCEAKTVSKMLYIIASASEVDDLSIFLMDGFDANRISFGPLLHMVRRHSRHRVVIFCLSSCAE